jgi:hypothetical protein
MMKRADLERALDVKRVTTIERHKNLIPALPDLYRLGLTVRQLETILPVGRQWIRQRLREQGVKFRPTGGRAMAERHVNPDAVIRVLKKHGIALNDLPAPKKARQR